MIPTSYHYSGKGANQWLKFLYSRRGHWILGAHFHTLTNNEWNILDESSASSLKPNIQLKHWQHISAVILPWIVAWIKIFLISPSLYLSFSHFHLNSTTTRFPLLILENYIRQEIHPRLYPIFSLRLMIPNKKIQLMLQKKPLCRNTNIPTRAILPSVIQLSTLNWHPLKTSCRLSSNWLKFGLRDQNLSKHIHMMVLSTISFPAAKHTSYLGGCGSTREVENWSNAWVI